MPVQITCPNTSCRGQFNLPQITATTICCPICKHIFASVPSTKQAADPEETKSLVGSDASSSSLSLATDPEETKSLAGADVPASGLPPILKIGRFEIRRELGEGAFGKVYEGYDPQLERAVAIKVAKLGQGDATQRVKRFLREAKAAAGLRHPHIVPVYEFGQEQDLFYIVSAFIRGGTLQQALRAKSDGVVPDFGRTGRTVRELAEALAYAHGQGIVHRDVKPANVLTDERGAPMLTDFGLASRLDEAEQLTHQGQVLGTPRYMAPEQARGREGTVVPASDQYALGIMFYEMLAGRTPFEGTVELVMFHHQETEPVPPRKHRPAVPPDLETICLKMLQKDPARRYADCGAVGEDLRRWAQGESILARPIGMWERGRRWARRNPLSALLMAAVAASLLLGTVISLMLAFHAERQAEAAQTNEKRANEKELLATANAKAAQEKEALAKEQAEIAKANAERAQRESEKAKRVADFLTGLFDASDPLGLTGYAFGPDPNQGAKLSAQEVLRRGAAKVGTELKDQPEIRAAVLLTVGSVLRTMGQYDDAQPLLEESLELRKRLPADRAPELAEAWFHMGWLHHMRGDDSTAMKCYREGLRLAQGAPSATDVGSRCEFNMAWLLTERKELREAETLFRKVLEERRKRLGNQHVETAAAQTGLASVLLHTDSHDSKVVSFTRVAEAVSLISPALETFRKAHGDESLANALALAQEAILAGTFGQVDVANKKMEKVTEISRQKLGDTHPFVAWSTGIHAYLLQQMGKKQEAITRYGECLEICRQGMGLDHLMVLRAVDGFGRLKSDTGDLAAARAPFEEMHAAAEKRKGKHHFLTVQVALMYGYFLHEQHLHRDAEAWLAKVLQAHKENPASFGKEACMAHWFLANATLQPRPAEAVEHVRNAIRAFESFPPDRRPTSFISRAMLQCMLVVALEKDRRLTELVPELAEFEKSSLVGVSKANELKEHVLLTKRHLPALAADEAVRVVSWLGRLTPGGGRDVGLGAAAQVAPLQVAEPLFNVEVGQRLDLLLDVEKHLTAQSPLDPRSKRPTETVKINLEKGGLYQFDLMSTEVDSLLTLRGPDGRALAQNDDGGGGLNSRIRWIGKEDGKHTLVCASAGKVTTGAVRLKCSRLMGVALLKAQEASIFKHFGEFNVLSETVGAEKRPLEKFTVPLESGTTYVIDLESKHFDSFLRLEDAAGKVIASDDDGGDGLNARIRIQPPRSADYRIVATSITPGAKGSFKLTVRPIRSEK